MKAIVGRIHPFGGEAQMTDFVRAALLAFGLVSLTAGWAPAAELPARYYRLMVAGCASIEKHLDEQPTPDLKTIERAGERHTGSSLEISWAHFGYAILPPAVLYAKQHPANPRYHDPKMLALAIRIGDLLAAADEKDEFEPRLDSDWDTYMWLEAYRLLAPELGEARRERWKQRIVRNAALLVPNAIDRLDSPWYQSPYLLTSPNHYAGWAWLLLVAGHMFGNEEWEKLGARILKRF